MEASGWVRRGEVKKRDSPGRYLDLWSEELGDKGLLLVVPGARAVAGVVGKVEFCSGPGVGLLRLGSGWWQVGS